jgi:hypothetical protein
MAAPADPDFRHALPPELAALLDSDAALAAKWQADPAGAQRMDLLDDFGHAGTHPRQAPRPAARRSARREEAPVLLARMPAPPRQRAQIRRSLKADAIACRLWHAPRQGERTWPPFPTARRAIPARSTFVR